MGNVCPYITNDGSVGLYSNDYNDIYHSVNGAYTEACEKFIIPADLEYYFSNDCINVLDICYGIGYNTKSLLQKFFEIRKNKSSQKYYNETIHSDNISDKNFPKLNIDAVDLDKNLFLLSPLIKTFKKFNLGGQNLPDDKYFKYLSKKVITKFRYDDYINFVILEFIVKTGMFDNEICELLENTSKNAFNKYHDTVALSYLRFLYDKGNLNTPYSVLSAFVHNIYYHHISIRYKTALEATNNNDISMNIYIDDARNFIKSSEQTYDLIFLDGFTTNKCPCLWTYEFFKELYEHLSHDGKLITYSNAAHVRNSMLTAGFYVGKIYNSNECRYTGSIAVKNKSFIKHELTESDLRLVKSRAGILYRDENLNASNEAILNRREAEVKNSPLLSSSQAAKINKERRMADV